MRHLFAAVTIVAFAVTLACADGNPGRATPTAAPAPTATEPSKTARCPIELPAVTLRYEASSQEAVSASYDWKGPDCSVNAHGIEELLIPGEPLVLPAGARPELLLSPAPDSLDVFAWAPNFDSATPLPDNVIQILLEPNAANRVERTDIPVEAVGSKELPLDTLPPGDYAVEIGGDWPEGRAGFVGRVKIEGP